MSRNLDQAIIYASKVVLFTITSTHETLKHVTVLVCKLNTNSK